MKVRDLMATEVTTVERNDTLSVVQDILKRRSIRHLPVLEDGRLVGILTQRDLFRAALSDTMGFGEKARTEFLKSVAVKEIMTEGVVTIGPGEDVKTAARQMLDHKIGCLPVVEKGKLVGLLTESDLLKTIAG